MSADGAPDQSSILAPATPPTSPMQPLSPTASADSPATRKRSPTPLSAEDRSVRRRVPADIAPQFSLRTVETTAMQIVAVHRALDPRRLGEITTRESPLYASLAMSWLDGAPIYLCWGSLARTDTMHPFADHMPLRRLGKLRFMPWEQQHERSQPPRSHPAWCISDLAPGLPTPMAQHVVDAVLDQPLAAIVPGPPAPRRYAILPTTAATPIPLPEPFRAVVSEQFLSRLLLLRRPDDASLPLSASMHLVVGLMVIPPGSQGSELPRPYMVPLRMALSMSLAMFSGLADRFSSIGPGCNRLCSTTVTAALCGACPTPCLAPRKELLCRMLYRYIPQLLARGTLPFIVSPHSECWTNIPPIFPRTSSAEPPPRPAPPFCIATRCDGEDLEEILGEPPLWIEFPASAYACQSCKAAAAEHSATPGMVFAAQTMVRFLQTRCGLRWNAAKGEIYGMHPTAVPHLLAFFVPFRDDAPPCLFGCKLNPEDVSDARDHLMHGSFSAKHAATTSAVAHTVGLKMIEVAARHLTGDAFTGILAAAMYLQQCAKLMQSAMFEAPDDPKLFALRRVELNAPITGFPIGIRGTLSIGIAAASPGPASAPGGSPAASPGPASAPGGSPAAPGGSPAALASAPTIFGLPMSSVTPTIALNFLSPMAVAPASSSALPWCPCCRIRTPCIHSVRFFCTQPEAAHAELWAQLRDRTWGVGAAMQDRLDHWLEMTRAYSTAVAEAPAPMPFATALACAVAEAILERAIVPRCPSCDTAYQLDSGCTHVFCSACGEHHCHCCMRRFVDHRQPTMLGSLHSETKAFLRRLKQDARPSSLPPLLRPCTIEHACQVAEQFALGIASEDALWRPDFMDPRNATSRATLGCSDRFYHSIRDPEARANECPLMPDDVAYYDRDEAHEMVWDDTLFRIPRTNIFDGPTAASRHPVLEDIGRRMYLASAASEQLGDHDTATAFAYSGALAMIRVAHVARYIADETTWPWANAEGEEERRSPRAEGGGERSPRAEGEEERRSPRAEGGGERSPRAEGEEERSPRAEGGGERSPRAEGEEERSPRAEGEEERSPRADGEAPSSAPCRPNALRALWPVLMFGGRRWAEGVGDDRARYLAPLTVPCLLWLLDRPVRSLVDIPARVPESEHTSPLLAPVPDSIETAMSLRQRLLVTVHYFFHPYIPGLSKRGRARSAAGSQELSSQEDDEVIDQDEVYRNARVHAKACSLVELTEAGLYARFDLTSL
jgi:hypothetical protein